MGQVCMDGILGNLDSYRLHAVPTPHGHDIKWNGFKRSAALEFMTMLQNLVTFNDRKSGKREYDCKLTKPDVVTIKDRYSKNRSLFFMKKADL